MSTATLELSLPVVLSLFTDLIGRTVRGDETAPADSSTAERTLRAVFVRSGEGPAALYAIDVELAAAMSAALVMMPPALVQDCVRDGALHPMLVDNAFEVCNVGARLVNRAGGTHYKLREQVLPGASLPADAAHLVAEATQRIDLELTVQGYGSGVLTILVL